MKRRFLWKGLILSVALAFGCLVLVLVLRAEGPPANIELLRGIVYGRGGERELMLDLSRPKVHGGKMPVLIMVHGGGWGAGDKKDYHSMMYGLSSLGIVCVTVQYRLAPDAQFPAQLEDVKCAIRWVRANALQYDLDTDRIAIFGGSAGAHLAVLAATTNGDPKWEGKGGHAEQLSTVCAAIGLSGPYDLTMGYKNVSKQKTTEAGAVKSMLQRFLGGTPDEMPQVYANASPVTHVKKDTVPMMLVHGSDDPLVLIEQSEVMEMKLKEAGVNVDFFRVEGGTHSDFGKDPEAAIQRIVAYIRKVLKV